MDWDPAKSDKLKKERGISFEEIIECRFVALEKHPKRSNQMNLLFEIEGQVWVVPCVVTNKEISIEKNQID